MPRELILTTCDSGAGNLKVSRISERVLSFTHRLVDGPIPAEAAPERFFASRRAIYEAEGLFFEPWWFEAEPSETSRLHRRVWSTLPALAATFDRVSLWIDPDPNAQLVLLQLLHWLGNLPDIRTRLWLKQAEYPLGGRHPGNWFVPPRPVEPDDVRLASRAWTAFGAPSPEPWCALLQDDLDRLPGLRPAVLAMLDELPDRSGLGHGARRVIRLAERHDHWDQLDARGTPIRGEMQAKDRCVAALVGRVQHGGTRLVPWFAEIEQTICDLATAACPALSGVTSRHVVLGDSFDADLYAAFREAPITLTDLGRRIRDAGEDWSRHNRVHRWWGGTRLTNETLWRWDAQAGRLSSPPTDTSM